MLLISQDCRFSIRLEEHLGHNIEEVVRFGDTTPKFRLTIFYSIGSSRYEDNCYKRVVFYNYEKDAIRVAEDLVEQYREVMADEDDGRRR